MLPSRPCLRRICWQSSLAYGAALIGMVQEPLNKTAPLELHAQRAHGTSQALARTAVRRTHDAISNHCTLLRAPTASCGLRHSAIARACVACPRAFRPQGRHRRAITSHCTQLQAPSHRTRPQGAISRARVVVVTRASVRRHHDARTSDPHTRSNRRCLGPSAATLLREHAHTSSRCSRTPAPRAKIIGCRRAEPESSRALPQHRYRSRSCSSGFSRMPAYAVITRKSSSTAQQIHSVGEGQVLWREGVKRPLTRRCNACLDLPPFRRVAALLAPCSACLAWQPSRARVISDCCSGTLAVRSRNRRPVSPRREHGMATRARVAIPVCR